MLQEFHKLKDGLFTTDGVVMFKDCVVIPSSLWNEILQFLHSAHQGVSSMLARAEASVFWPGITSAITTMRNQCTHCNCMAPSQPSAPPSSPILPDYPFQHICADFHHKGIYYLVIVDRYSNWPVVERNSDGAIGLIACLCCIFVIFRISEELSSDGNPEFTAATTREFFEIWGVNDRLSSVAFPHSNCRDELGVKTVKRLITNNTGPNGELNTDAFQRAMLQYRNSPATNTKLSPAMCILETDQRLYFYSSRLLQATPDLA